jgi:hypothetical protein
MAKTKILYVLIGNNGDGSYYPRYTFNKNWINEQEEKYQRGELDYEADLGIDGDGFHYDELTVPSTCTLDSLGIDDCAEKD